ncbi:MAG: hypothetical protein M1839_007743 [Geoglossum umbratile]|nr:MAG: hypothetical protein M1839_007743 [Geoglossum umbratile]
MQEGPDTDWYDDSPTSIPPYSPSSESGGETPMVEEGDQENLLPLALGTADWTQEGLGWYGEFGEATGGRKAPHAELKSSYGQLESLGRIHKPPQPGSASLDSGEGCTKIGPLGLPFSTSELSRGRLAPKEIAPICKGEFEFPVLYLCTPGSTNPDGRGIRPRSTRPPGFGRDPSQESDDYRKPTAESPELWDGNWLSLAEDQEGELLEEPTWSSGFDWVPYTHFEPRTSALSPRSIAPRLRELNDSGEEI